jgi:arylsulfatase A-like enzyme
MTVSRAAVGDRMKRSSPTSGERNRLGILDLIVLSTWCGLAAGLIEVGARILLRAINPTKRLYMMTRHFVWLSPLSNLLVFVGLGLCLAMLVWFWPKLGAWVGARLILAFTVLPALMVAGPRIYQEAWFVLAIGIGFQAAPWLERNPVRLKRLLILSFPGLVSLVLILAGTVVGGDWLKERREAARPFPTDETPNVLLIVLDTVRADRLSLYGYERPTTPTLERLAKSGIRFDEARATAPWTLASHASFFTGRWPHELGVQWVTPLRGDFPMLAEYLASHGYSTAGFVANAGYCSYDTGLSVGFTHYEDYVLERLGPLRTAVLIDSAVKTVLELTRPFQNGIVQTLRDWMSDLFFSAERKSAARVNREFVDWLDRRPEPSRPFFVFLNFLDAHTPYLLPPGSQHRFGPQTGPADDDMEVLTRWSFIDKANLAPKIQRLARDSYDNCIAYLDDQLRVLFDDLRRRGVLDRMFVIVTSDHGEGLGEHLLYMHGESLYRTEIRVPLLILPASQRQAGSVVNETVSLRDLPATIVDLVGLGKTSPFPGRSLARFWDKNPGGSPPVEAEGAFCELASPNPLDPNQGRSPAHRGPLVSVAEGGFVYIRNEKDGSEELFDERDGPRELINRARQNSMEPTLQRLRRQVGRIRNRAAANSAR